MGGHTLTGIHWWAYIAGHTLTGIHWRAYNDVNLFPYFGVGEISTEISRSISNALCAWSRVFKERGIEMEFEFFVACCGH